jgi:hypothetical protein
MTQPVITITGTVQPTVNVVTEGEVRVVRVLVPGEQGPKGEDGPPGTTDLALANRGASTLDITSSSGTDVTLPAATTSLTGLLTATDKTRLDGAASVGLAAGLAIALG